MEAMTFDKILFDLSIGIYDVVKIKFKNYSCYNSFKKKVNDVKYNGLKAVDSIFDTTIIIARKDYPENLYSTRGSYTQIDDDKFLDIVSYYKDVYLWKK